MASLKSSFSTTELTQALEISPSGFAAHRLKEKRPRAQQDQKLAALIKPLFQESRRTYGSPRLCLALRKAGTRCGKNRIARLMREHHLKALQKRRFRPRTTDSAHPFPIAENHLGKAEKPTRPNRIWQSDITYIPTLEGFAYLAVTLDACSRKVVGWQLKDHMEATLVTETLERACHRRRPAVELLHHSDRGVQYASHAFRSLLESFHMQPSMSRKGNCYDNALAESFFATLKTECLATQPPANTAQARLMIFDYIETFYNPKRFHSALGYQSPVDFEKQFN
jgi:transposase InsO family protein